MSSAQFRNALCILLSIDRDELPPLRAEQWYEFNNDPVRLFLRADDELAAVVWAVIEARQPQEVGVTMIRSIFVSALACALVWAGAFVAGLAPDVGVGLVALGLAGVLAECG